MSKKLLFKIQKLLMTENRLNQLKLVCAHSSKIVDKFLSKKNMVLQNQDFIPFLTKLTFNAILLNIPTYKP